MHVHVGMNNIEYAYIHTTDEGSSQLQKRSVYSEYSLICHDSFQRIRWINEFGGLTGYSLVPVHYSLLVQYWEIMAD